MFTDIHKDIHGMFMKFMDIHKGIHEVGEYS